MPVFHEGGRADRHWKAHLERTNCTWQVHKVHLTCRIAQRLPLAQKLQQQYR
jgi:hypothetical protein